MYGTVAKLKTPPRQRRGYEEPGARQRPPGIVFEHIYKLDSGDNEYMMVVGFESKEAYQTNADSPEMHEMYLEYRNVPGRRSRMARRRDRPVDGVVVPTEAERPLGVGTDVQ